MNITITIPDQHVQRVADMVRSELPDTDPVTGDPIDWTNQDLIVEFKQKLREQIKAWVQQYELLEQHKQVFENYTPLETTTD